MFDFAPIRFIAIASVSCASWLIEPYDIAPVEKRFTIVSTGSTSSIGTGGREPLKRIRPRSVASREPWSSTSRVYSLKIAYCPERVACCSLKTVCGLNRWYSPSRRHWYSPPQSRSASPDMRRGYAFSCRRATSSATTSMPTPPMRDGVHVKYLSTKRCDEAERLEDLRAAVALRASRCPSWTSP